MRSEGVDADSILSLSYIHYYLAPKSPPWLPYAVLFQMVDDRGVVDFVPLRNEGERGTLYIFVNDLPKKGIVEL